MLPAHLQQLAPVHALQPHELGAQGVQECGGGQALELGAGGLELPHLQGKEGSGGGRARAVIWAGARKGPCL